MDDTTLTRSAASRALEWITERRNPQGEQSNWIANEKEYVVRPWIWTRLKAEVLYAATIALAVAEIALARVARVVTTPLERQHRFCTGWERSSEFALRMSKLYLRENFWAANLPTDPEEVYRRLAYRAGETTVAPWEMYQPWGRRGPTPQEPKTRVE